MNKGSIVERLCSDLIAKNRDINGLLYFYLVSDLMNSRMICCFCYKGVGTVGATGVLAPQC